MHTKGLVEVEESEYDIGTRYFHLLLFRFSKLWPGWSELFILADQEEQSVRTKW